MLLSWHAKVNMEDGLIYALATDITQKKKAEDDLIASKIELEKSKAKDVFLANMSHEIRTPLNAIIGFNDLLCKTHLDREQQGHVEIIGNALKNLNVIINDILDLSKLESGKLELEMRPFSIESLVKQVVQMHLARAKAKNLKLMLSFDSEIPEYVIGDETRLSQILINLVSNAVKFTSQGNIEIKATEVSRQNGGVSVRFSVRDSGIGIDPAKLSMIFERFTQAEDYTTRMYGGTGLGLTIVKSLVDLHRGELYVDSIPGKGSEFAIELSYPISTESPAESDSTAQLKSNTVSLKGIRVLLVEDNEHNQILAKTYLERNGATVEIAGNGLIGIQALSKNTFDVILMDIQMPVMDGLQTTERIRNELLLEIPIIGCSAHALESEKTLCMEAGMNDYITKPYSELDLINAFVRRKLVKSAAPTIESTLSELVEKDNVVAIFRHWQSHYGRDTMELLLNALRDRIPNDIHKINSYLQTGDNQGLEALAHNMASSLGGLRLMQGMALTKKLEHASKRNNKEVMESVSKELVAYLNDAFEEAKLL
ncbi:MAG: ATP-binding protein, partial [Bacteroidota bacterium]